MTDYLLVHGAGQGAWSWGSVWGYLTAPTEHPPRLYTPRRANRVLTLDLPGHGADADGDTGDVRLEECVHAITRAVEREELKDLVLVGHGFAGGLVLQAAGQLPQPPKRIVLVAGMVPHSQRTMLSVLPKRTKASFRLLSTLSKLTGGDLRLPRPVIYSYLCNGMDPMEVVRVLGFFGPIPTRVLNTRLTLDPPEPASPVTYIVLTQDRIIPAELQKRMAQRVPGVELVEVDSCHQVMQYRPKELAEILLAYA
ncbi:MAG: alpha/beta hydrolase [Chloroflexi bacterium]|nr:alpha/beta hydrolase [Chloroflexota bacterium]MCI0779780.1 alpha/beta hydrolase [Chloroflexota bacterium]MCI0785627.1 alpha/beta hydrolase [Chloroflexota bacterium]MCI0792239.1 alpha/beta hydrolase [Chloroflexota bacterium]MCI0798045.1 alpha/beta hydrolase [Chloroflexota bacterium]